MIDVDEKFAQACAERTLKDLDTHGKPLGFTIDTFLQSIRRSYLVTDVRKCQGLYLQKFGELLCATK